VKGDGTPASSSYNLPGRVPGMLFDPVLSDNLRRTGSTTRCWGRGLARIQAGYADGANVYQSFGDAPSEQTTRLDCGVATHLDDGKRQRYRRQGDTIKELAAALLGHESTAPRSAKWATVT